MDKYMKGWFIEMNDMWPGQAMALQVDEILHHEKSQYQDILVFNTYVCVYACVCVCVRVCVCMCVCVLDSTLKIGIISNHLPFPSHPLKPITCKSQ